MRFVQLKAGDARRVAVVEEPKLRLLRDFDSMYALAQTAIKSGGKLTSTTANHLSEESLDYDQIYEGRASWKLLPPIDHPQEIARCLVSGTGLTHLGSARDRASMHMAKEQELTDSMKMFHWGLGHKIPESAASWFYVFGSATLLCFVIQIITGACLAFVYVPSTNEAWSSLNYLNDAQSLGWYLRAVHNWSSNFMVAIVTLHMIQVFLFGAYKYPRELTWVSGVFLLLFTLGMAFTGQVLRFDQDAYWGLGIGASVAGRVPLIGGRLVQLILGGPIIAGETLSRFFSLHVFIIPGLIIALVSMHLRLVLTKGINEFPKPGHPVNKATYDAEYEEILHKEGIPFVPNGIGKDLIFAALVIVGILACAAIFGPKGPGGPPDPTIVNTNPRPDFYFLAILRR